MPVDSSDLVQKYFPKLSETQLDRIIQLKELYNHWNRVINVISRQDIDYLYERHILHSLGIASLVQFKPDTTVLDIGTGGGFPGIPLAIFFPSCKFHLVDSIGKKVKVVQAVIDALQLENVTTKQERAEDVEGQYDFVVSRAVKPLKQMLDWVEKSIKPEGDNFLQNGMLCLKGGDLTEEVDGIQREIRIFDLKEIFEEDFFAEKKLVYIKV